MTAESMQILTGSEAAAYLRVSPKTLARLRADGEICYVAITIRKIVYRKEDLDSFIATRARLAPPPEPTSPARKTARRKRGTIVSFTERRNGKSNEPQPPS